MTDLDILERRHLQDIGAFERKIALMASRMTLAEVNAELMRLPASPQNDRDLLARGAMTRRRYEILEAQRPHPNAPPPVNESGMVDINVPDGCDISCIQSQTVRGKYYYREQRAGRWVIQAPWSEFTSLVFSVHSTAGHNGGMWADANQHLISRLPQNPPSPLPESPRYPTMQKINYANDDFVQAHRRQNVAKASSCVVEPNRRCPQCEAVLSKRYPSRCIACGAVIKAARPVPSDDALLARGAAAALRKRDPHAIMVSDNHPRIIVGDVEAGEHGRLFTEVDQSADVIHLHGIPVPLADIRRDLRLAVVASSAAFSRAITDQEQGEQRAVIGPSCRPS